MRRFISYGPALVVLMTVIAVLMAGPAAVRRIGSANTQAHIVLAQRSLDDDDILERINKAVRNVADTVRPSVVHIEVIPYEGRRFAVRSTGTGWVYDTAGHIVTNAHVVKGASAISVTFPDGRVARTEKIHGEAFVADPNTDIAVIKVPESDDVFAAKRATGIQPQQGDHVFVFGSPFGFKFSMSQGIVSGLGRDPSASTEAGNGYTNYIQTDAAVNPGNSGGPLVDIKGRVIGMNVAIATARSSDGTTGDEGQSAGISFAIPLGTIESVADQLISKGTVRRGYLGVSWSQFRDPAVYDPAIKAAGVQIQGVSKDGPAQQAGLEGGDIILSIAGQATPSMPVLRSVITTLGPGQTVPVKVSREGRTHEYNVTLGEFSGEALAQANIESALQILRQYGVLMRDTGGRRRATFADLIAQPAIVREIEAESPAKEAGFKAGQSIVQVGDKAVKTLGEFCDAMVVQGLLIGKRIPVVVVEDGDTTSPEPKTIELQVLR